MSATTIHPILYQGQEYEQISQLFCDKMFQYQAQAAVDSSVATNPGTAVSHVGILLRGLIQEYADICAAYSHLAYHVTNEYKDKNQPGDINAIVFIRDMGEWRMYESTVSSVEIKPAPCMMGMAVRGCLLHIGPVLEAGAAVVCPMGKRPFNREYSVIIGDHEKASIMYRWATIGKLGVEL